MFNKCAPRRACACCCPPRGAHLSNLVLHVRVARRTQDGRPMFQEMRGRVPGVGSLRRRVHVCRPLRAQVLGRAPKGTGHPAEADAGGRPQRTANVSGSRCVHRHRLELTERGARVEGSARRSASPQRHPQPHVSELVHSRGSRASGGSSCGPAACAPATESTGITITTPALQSLDEGRPSWTHGTSASARSRLGSARAHPSR